MSDNERELNDLRARAYGPEPDIGADPAAMARLIELEAAHVGAATPITAKGSIGGRVAYASPTDRPARDSVAPSPSAEQAKPAISREGFGSRLWQPATATRNRVLFLVGSICVVAAIIYSATWLLVPHPDATLQPTAGETDTTVIEVLNAQDAVRGISTIRQFERYHDIDVWSVRSTFGKTCLIAWDRAGGRFDYQCLDPGVDVALRLRVVAEASDGFGDWLPDGSVVSLHLRENTVDVFVHSPQAAT